MTRDANTASARAMVDEWTRGGVTEAVVAPGSRSTPLALALADHPAMRVHVHVDERSAAFFALGVARQSGRPALVLCTSGTAAASFHPAVLEASHGRVPLLVCTADRPPELRDAGAGQTIDQLHLYGNAVRWFCEVGVPDDVPGAGAVWRAIAARAVDAAMGRPAGPVHLNLAYREPLVPTGAELVDAPGRAGGRPWTRSTRAALVPDEAMVERVAQSVRDAERGVLVAGWGAGVEPATARRFAEAAGWPVLADPVSQLRTGDHAVSTYDPLLRSDAFAARVRADVVLRVGAPPTNKPANAWLSTAEQWVVDPDDAWLDPQRSSAERLVVDADALLRAVTDQLAVGTRRPWFDEWIRAERQARRAIDDLLDGWEEPFEGRVARDVVAGAPDGATLVVASSMPVRDVESFAAPRTELCFVANRGVNGIDGFVSTAIGCAAASDRPVVALTGDLGFLHDTNGLLGASRREADVTFVVVDNDGGGIFSFLPQADAVPEHFEMLFRTPHGVDLASLARVHDVPAIEIEKAHELRPALDESVAAGGVRLVLVRTDAGDNVARHREVWEAVAAAV